MPRQIDSLDEFLRISSFAKECRVKRMKDNVKLKLRTSSLLYTHQEPLDAVDEVLKKIKCPIIEL